MKKRELCLLVGFLGLFIISPICAAQDGPAGRPKVVVKTSALPNTFREVAAELDLGGHYFRYMSLAQANRNVEARTKKLYKATLGLIGDAPVDLQFKVATAVLFNVIQESGRELGMQHITGVGESVLALGKGRFRVRQFWHHDPAQKKGLYFQWLGGKPHQLEGLKLFPEDTVIAYHGDFDFAAMWPWLSGKFLKIVGELAPPQAQLEITSVLQSPIFKDVVNSLAGEAGFLVTMNEDGAKPLPIPIELGFPEVGFALVLKVKDNTIQQLLAGMLAGMPVQEKQAGKVTLKVHAVELPAPVGAFVDVTPTIFRTGDYLVLASSEAVARRIVGAHSGTGPGLNVAPEFKTLSAGMDLTGNHMYFQSNRIEKYFRKAFGGVPDLPGDYAVVPVIIEALFPTDVPADSRLTVVRFQPNGMLSDGRTTVFAEQAQMEGVAMLPHAVLAGGMFAYARSMANEGVPLPLPGGLNRPPQFGPVGVQMEQMEGRAREIELALKIHAEDNGVLPGANWKQVVGFQVNAAGGFILNAAVAGKKPDALSPDTVMLFEGEARALEVVGGLKTAQQHPDIKAGRTILVKLLNGMAKKVTAQELAALNWTGAK